MKTKQISLTLDQEILNYIDELSTLNSRSRSGMINWILAKEKAADEALAEEGLNYEGIQTEQDQNL